ncbi:MAG: vWA domain-containing protein [Bacteroidia bacterium]
MLQAQDSKKTRFLFLLDCSGSMENTMNGQKRMAVAHRILNRMVDSLKDVPNVELAFRTYGLHGSRTEENCRDTKLEVPFYKNNSAAIKEKVGQSKPNGTTPIAFSLTQSASDFPNSNANNFIILITDGLEECKGDPCAVSQALQSRKIILKPFIIGLGMKEDYSKYFDCVGRFYNAQTEADFQTILSTVLTQALNNTTVQVNLNDANGRPTQTNVNMTFYNAKSSLVAYNYYHTMNSGKPDTFLIDPIAIYNLQVHTTPPIIVKDVSIRPSEHNIIKVNAPQGDLVLKVKSSDYGNLKCLVKRANTNDLIHVQDFNTTHRYIAGTYDVEILTLPRIYINDVKIKQGDPENIEIPSPGKLDVTYGLNSVVSVFVLRNNKQEWVADMDGNKNDKQVLYLQPGSYKLVYRRKEAKDTKDSREIDFKITSSQYTSLSLE